MLRVEVDDGRLAFDDDGRQVQLVAAARVEIRAQTVDQDASSARTGFASLSSDQIVQRMMRKEMPLMAVRPAPLPIT